MNALEKVRATIATVITIKMNDDKLHTFIMDSHMCPSEHGLDDLKNKWYCSNGGCDCCKKQALEKTYK